MSGASCASRYARGACSNPIRDVAGRSGDSHGLGTATFDEVAGFETGHCRSIEQIHHEPVELVETLSLRWWEIVERRA